MLVSFFFNYYLAAPRPFIIKNELLKSMNVHLSPFLSAYRKNYNTQHVLLRLLEEWREHLANNKTAGGILMDLYEGF